MMLNLRRVVIQKLREYNDRVYYQHAPNDKKYPYIVYNFPNSFTDEEQEVFNLDVDIWDNKQDTSVIENLMTDIWRGLQRYRYIDDDIQLSIYRDTRLPPLDEDEVSIKRRKMIFQVRYFDRRI